MSFVEKDGTVKDLGIVYCCDTCNPNGRWFPLTEDLHTEPTPPKESRRRRRRKDEPDAPRFND